MAQRKLGFFYGFFASAAGLFYSGCSGILSSELVEKIRKNAIHLVKKNVF